MPECNQRGGLKVYGDGLVPERENGCAQCDGSVCVCARCGVSYCVACEAFGCAPRAAHEPDLDEGEFEGACNVCGGSHCYCARCGVSYCVICEELGCEA